MIDKIFIDSAREIRKKFIKTSTNLKTYQTAVENLLNFLKEKADILKNIESNEFKNKPTKDEIQRVTRLIVAEINDIEQREKVLVSKIEVLNDDLSKIQVEEELLYKKLKERYPKLTDDELKKEIQRYFA